MCFLSHLSEKLLYSIVCKLPIPEQCRMRQSCTFFDDFVEKYGQQLAGRHFNRFFGFEGGEVREYDISNEERTEINLQFEINAEEKLIVIAEIGYYARILDSDNAQRQLSGIPISAIYMLVGRTGRPTPASERTKIIDILNSLKPKCRDLQIGNVPVDDIVEILNSIKCRRILLPLLTPEGLQISNTMKNVFLNIATDSEVSFEAVKNMRSITVLDSMPRGLSTFVLAAVKSKTLCPLHKATFVFKAENEIKNLVPKIYHEVLWDSTGINDFPEGEIPRRILKIRSPGMFILLADFAGMVTLDFLHKDNSVVLELIMDMLRIEEDAKENIRSKYFDMSGKERIRMLQCAFYVKIKELV